MRGTSRNKKRTSRVSDFRFACACSSRGGCFWPRTAPLRPSRVPRVSTSQAVAEFASFGRRAYPAVGRNVIVRVAAFSVPSHSLNRSSPSTSRREFRPIVVTCTRPSLPRGARLLFAKLLFLPRPPPRSRTPITSRNINAQPLRT